MTIDFNALAREAHAAGDAAAVAATPRPMHVEGFATVEDGVCGFAWVNVKGNTAFGRFAARVGWRKDSYYGGRTLWVRAYGQSYTRKLAYATAYAKVLNDAGVPATAMGRMD